MSESSVFEWLDIFDSAAGEWAAVRHQISDNGDGIRHYDAPQAVRMVRISTIQSCENDEMRLKLVLLLPGTAAVKAGDLIIVDGRRCEVCSVELCSAVSGEIIARKCVIK